MSQKNRVHLIDEIRGLAVIGMVVVHAIISIGIFAGQQLDITGNSVFIFIREAGGALFIFISGAACRFSSNNLKRGVIRFGFAMAITLVTWLIMPAQIIRFGVLHLLGICMMLYAILQKALNKLPVMVGFVICSVIFALLYNIQSGVVGISGIADVSLPSELYKTQFLFPFGMPNVGFCSSDYYPILPWLFIFLAGSYVGIPLKDRKFPSFFYNSHVKILQKIGRHSLVIYLAHQPLIFGILYLISYIT